LSQLLQHDELHMRQVDLIPHSSPLVDRNMMQSAN